MNHPTNKAQFIRHIEQNPHLVYRSPGKVFGEVCQDVFEGRLWTKTTSKRCQFLIIGTENHGCTFMEFKAREMEFFPDRIEVKFPPSWEDLADERIVYWYASEPYDRTQRPIYEKKLADR